MKSKLSISVFLFIILMITCLKTVNAQDYQDYIDVEVIVEALQGSKVYVHPETGYTTDTSIMLQNSMRSNDSIVLIVLSENAVAKDSIEDFVEKISKGLSDDYIIGIAVGKDVIGYATLLPKGVAEDQMRRANSVSNDPITALVTYVQNIHLWIDKHPLPTLTPTSVPTPIPKTEEERAKVWTFVKVVAIAAVVSVFVPIIFISIFKKGKKGKDYGDISSKLQKDVDRDLRESKDSLEIIRELISNLPRNETQETLWQAYEIVSKEIVGEIDAEPRRATPTTIYRIKKDLSTFSAILQLYSKLVFKEINRDALPTGYMHTLEHEFFPDLKDAFHQIAVELDKGDVILLENLVREQSNQLQARGLL